MQKHIVLVKNTIEVVIRIYTIRGLNAVKKFKWDIDIMLYWDYAHMPKNVKFYMKN